MLQELQDELFELRQRTTDQPYSIPHRLKLAKAYQNLGYPDLGAGDAYKALVLIDEVREEGEYHEEAVEAAVNDFEDSSGYQHDLCCGQNDCDTTQIDSNPSDEAKAIEWAKNCWSKAAYVSYEFAWVDLTRLRYNILVPCLLECDCLRSAFDYNARSLHAFPQSDAFKAHQQTLLSKLHLYYTSRGETFEEVAVQDYPDKGLVRRELYPWNEYEPNRFAPEVLQVLNDELESIAPRLMVKVAELPLLRYVFYISSPILGLSKRA